MITGHGSGPSRLADKLAGKTLVIQWEDVPEHRPGLNGSFNYRTGTITMYNWESNTLFHEMFHGLQAYNHTPDSFEGSTLNMETEAWYAQYLYVSGLPEYQQGTKWHKRYSYGNPGKQIANLANAIDNKGYLKPGVTDANFSDRLNYVFRGFNQHPSYAGRSWDSSKLNPQDMFGVLRQITENCKSNVENSGS